MASRPSRPLRGIRVLSLALNLPGPAALMRLHALGAKCVKLEPTPAKGAPSADPMAIYSPQAYTQLHAGVRVVHADLKTAAGQRRLHQLLQGTDVLVTSFRPSALTKLGLDWRSLHRAHPSLCHVVILGETGERGEIPGHDLTYLAAHGLVKGLDLPPTLYADMAGSLAACEATLALLWQRSQSPKGLGGRMEVGLSESAAHLSLPWHWGLTQASGPVGGAHAGYGVYACRDGRVAVAALEPHFAHRLCQVAGLVCTDAMAHLMSPKAPAQLKRFFASQSKAQLEDLAARHDLPMHTLD